ncbi:hypothetical protein HMI54_014838 [Coelomomyces lativittatus]|nr:hypothetical protein HMI55_005825 [Coelomomyces lativittatus]KAJ1513611.1 hypothetical protein HMI54_014838 [Coelomomyces lativittatus]KAJ1515849.1 hypothetical protein HMI56_000019 [Coelomomyces lativittatus]
MSQNILNRINIKDDYYAILEIDRTASESTIKKAYYKLSLQLHPDKNPGNPKAKEAYHKVKLAYALFTDLDAKSQYDAIFDQNKNKTIHLQKLNKEKRKMREDLINREKAAEESKRKKVDPVILNRSAEIERVRYENEKMLRELEREMYQRTFSGQE